MAVNCLKSFLPAIGVALFLSGCTWVKTDPGADQVKLVSAAEVRQCQRLGQTTASVRDRLGAVQRRAERVAEELADLARNSALELGGNNIVAEGPVQDGQRRFGVYRCTR